MSSGITATWLVAAVVGGGVLLLVVFTLVAIGLSVAKGKRSGAGHPEVEPCPQCGFVAAPGKAACPSCGSKVATS